MDEEVQRQHLQPLRHNHHLARFVVEGRATGEHLGTGSYGSVEEIEVNGLICAGKRIHEVLIDADNVGIDNIARKYVQECQLMSDLRHPNITLFLGVCFLPNCQLPVLLMERLDGSLDDLLEMVPKIPLALKRSVLEDVSRGLLYLHKHTPQIIHRDLTAKNILLTPSLVAKISDFGNSRIVNLHPGQLARTLSRLPGTLVYMPPEALSAASHYGPSLDVFSFGHLALFTLNQVFPANLLESTYPDPDNPDSVLGRTEVERRKTYIDLLQNDVFGVVNHPLMLLVKQCLQNAPSRRPTTEELVTELHGMKADIEGPCGAVARADAVRQVVMMREIIKRDSAVELKMRELETKDEEIQRLQLAQEDELHQKDILIQQKASLLNESHQQVTCLQAQNVRLEEVIQRKEGELRQCTDQICRQDAELKHKDLILEQREAEIQRLQKQIDVIQRESEPYNTLVTGGSGQSCSQVELSFKWRKVMKMPFAMGSYPSAVVIKDKVYIGGGWAPSNEQTQTVMKYDPQRDEWTTLPQYGCMHFGMVNWNDHLLVVGGIDVTTKESSASLGVLDHANKWTHPFPPMPTARRSPAAVMYDNRWLLVIGGKHAARSTQLSCVEVLDTGTTSCCWYKSVPLPRPLSHGSVAIIGRVCYILGGFSSEGSPSKNVFSISLEGLIAQAAPPKLIVSRSASESTLSSPSNTLWKNFPDSPLMNSTALPLNVTLLAIGGEWMKCTNRVIYAYQQANSQRQWMKIGELPTGRMRCACTVLPNREVIVAGGSSTIDSSLSRTVEVAELQTVGNS